MKGPGRNQDLAIMTSRLKLRKKKYHPPLQEIPTQLNIDKNNQNLLKTNIRVSAEVAGPSSQAFDENLKKTNMKASSQIESSSAQSYDEKQIFNRAIASAQKHNIKLKPGRKDRGYGN